MKSIGAILLAGGQGTRMGTEIPKQFLFLEGKPIALYSFEALAFFPEVQEMVVVCSPLYRDVFASVPCPIPLTFADPGARRQDSVLNGFNALSSSCDLVCIHDAARPFIDASLIQTVLKAAATHGAAAAGAPVKCTIKKQNEEGFVEETLDRSQLWEIQTPQAIASPLLRKGFNRALENRLTVTDDVSLIELLSLPVKLVEGPYHNLKITTPEDLAVARHLVSILRAE